MYITAITLKVMIPTRVRVCWQNVAQICGSRLDTGSPMNRDFVKQREEQYIRVPSYDSVSLSESHLQLLQIFVKTRSS